MKVAGNSKAHAVLGSCMYESHKYFSDHEKILKHNPYCKNVSYLPQHDLFKWTFEVSDPRNNPVVALFFVKENQESITACSSEVLESLAKYGDQLSENRSIRKISWTSSTARPDIKLPNSHTFIGETNSMIHLFKLENNQTLVSFETNITLDFKLSFPLSLMPEPVLKFMSESIMSQIMQHATESMLCRVQSDICTYEPDVTAKGGALG
ncbi:hypothetical protein Ptc2401_00219 [Prosthecochloris sp. CIB 2401]|nr:DUF1997 domain-containing protein [Prosthecochloris sp. CIB 2401]ANT64027.1 hypothetical protein Ptc2401_00219 [Prosthecochloris sp. CIB 2401]